MVKRLILPNSSGLLQQAIYAPSRGSLDQLQNALQLVWPTLGISQWGKQKMHMLWHDHSGMESKSRSIAVQAVLKNHIASFGRQRIPIELSKCHKYRPVCFLVMRQPAPVLVLVSSSHCGADIPLDCARGRLCPRFVICIA